MSFENLKKISRTAEDFVNVAYAGVFHGEHKGRNMLHMLLSAGLLSTMFLGESIASGLGATAEAENAVHGFVHDGVKDIKQYPDHALFKHPAP